MATISITTANWNSPSFWSSINYGSGGHTFDFSSLPSNFTVSVNQMSGQLTIDNGSSDFTVRDATTNASADASMGGNTEFSFFDFVLPDGNDWGRGDENANNFDGGGGDDTIEGGTEDDTISGGSGNDVLYGDAESPIGVTESFEVGSLTMSPNEVRDGSAQGGNPSNANDGTSVIYDNAAQLEDGTNVAMRVTLVDKSSSNLNVNLTNGTTNQTILLSGGSSQQGETAEIRIEFLDQATGEPLVLSGSATFSDLDDNSGSTGTAENLVLDAGYFSSFAVSQDSSLEVSQSNGMVTAKGTEQNNPNDQDAWFQAMFDGKSEINFTLIYPGVTAGFGFNGQDITNSVVTPVIAGNDTLDGESGDDQIDGGGGDDTILGGQGDDTLIGGAGNDEISGGSGEDFIRGGGGNDTILAGGDDTVSGDDGDDVFRIDPDALTGGGTISITGGEGDETLGDTLDFNGQLDWGSVVITDDDDENGGLTGYATLRDGTVVNFSQIETVLCFAEGTRLSTPKGDIAVEDLAEGDLIDTLDHGPQPIRWKRASPHGWAAESNDQKPVQFKPGSLGAGLPRRELVVSPQHRMLVPDAEDGQLVAAKALLDLPGVRQQNGRRRVTYHHLFFDRHQVLFAEGAPTESFYPGVAALRSLSAADRNSLRPLLLHQEGEGYAPVRPLMKVQCARHLVAAGLATWSAGTLKRLTGRASRSTLRVVSRDAG
ncbi:Hint domain-containing protein [Pseudooceanicola aestuarii]|uniref:Hint domain-containing protein n=1 Tax=Pseudooceanicola aestuarii TaxID=2697319 RepID=UPI0013D4D342|nr:Hint domain-containing protein [Pseudooceanicola aestuarii]